MTRKRAVELAEDAVFQMCYHSEAKPIVHIADAIMKAVAEAGSDDPVQHDLHRWADQARALARQFPQNK